MSPSALGDYVRWLTQPVARRRRSRRKSLERRDFIGSTRVNGFDMYVDLRSGGSAKRLFVERRHEPAETAFFESRLRPGMTVLDVGANLGYFTLLASRLVGANGRVIALEPDPHNFSLLSLNVERNAAHNVHPRNVAAGEETNLALIFLSTENFGDHRLVAPEGSGRRALDIVCRRVDEILEPDETIDFIKLDVQGYELFALRGMERTLAQNADVTLLFEFSPAHLQQAGVEPRALLDHLVDRGFSLGILEDDGSTTRIGIDAILDSVRPTDQRMRARYINLVAQRDKMPASGPSAS